MRKVFALFVAAMFLIGHDACAANTSGDVHRRIIAEMNPEWIECQQQSHCKLIHFGCDGIEVIAANARHYSQAQDLAYKIGGDPMTINCTKTQYYERPNYVAMCEGGQCVLDTPSTGNQ